MDENFNNIGSDFDELFDESSAITVENSVEESQEKVFELPDDMDDYGVIEEKSSEDDNPETSNDPDSTEPELDV